MISFNIKYLWLTILLLAIETFIALFVRDSFVRPLLGDALVVALVYCFFRIFLAAAFWKVALGALVFAFTVETLQYFDYVALLGLENNRVMSVALGRTFEWADFAAYFAGFLLILVAEKTAGGGNNRRNL